jgi:sugar lactone lactonase YvrE
VIDATGHIIVSDLGRLIRVNPSTGAQSILSDNSRGPLGLPFGIALDRSGLIVAANLQAIVQVQPVSGQIQILSAGDRFGYPLGVVVANSGQLFVLNISSSRQILRVNPLTGAQRVIAQGGLLKNPQALAISGNDLYVTDVATLDGNFGIGRVIHVDAQSGAQSVIAQGGYLVGPVGIAVDESGRLVVGDPYTINLNSPDLYDGAIVRIDPATGHQTLLARGEGSFVNPRGVAIVPSSFPNHK